MVAKTTLSRMEATVSTPPTIAHVLEIPINAKDKRDDEDTYDVRKCANDCRVSECTTSIGEISKLKKAPRRG